MNLAAIQEGTIAMMVAARRRSGDNRKLAEIEASVTKSKAFNDWMNWCERCDPREPLNCDPPDVQRDIREGRAAQERYRERFTESVEEITRLCAKCGLPFCAGWSHAPKIWAFVCPECASARTVAREPQQSGHVACERAGRALGVGGRKAEAEQMRWRESPSQCEPPSGDFRP